MEYNNIFLFIIILFVFLCFCKKKIKNRKKITQKYGLTKIKNKDNVIEYYENVPGENCSQITKEFVNQMFEKQELIRFNQQQNVKDLDKIGKLQDEIKGLHNTMKQQCREQPRCKIKYYGPGENNDINDTICKEMNDSTININQCRPGSGNGNGNVLGHWPDTLRPNGSRFIKFNKVMTDSWDNINISNKYMLDNESISPEDFEYELNQPLSYVIRYDKDNFESLFNNGSSLNFKHPLFKNSPTYKVISPISNLNQVNQRRAFENSSLTSRDNLDDIKRIKDLLKILFMKQELGDIYTQEEIEQIESNYDDQGDDTVPAYLKGKYDEIQNRVDGFGDQDCIFTLKNMQANILVESHKNIFDYCDFAPTEIPNFNNEKPKDLQKKFDSNTNSRYFDRDGDFKVEVARNDCRNKGGEFIELMNDENDESKKEYFCLSKEEFKNPKNTYYYSYYDITNNRKLINSSDFTDVNEFKKQVSEDKIKSGKVERRKTGIKSGDRIFSLSFDNLCKQCDKKFDGHGVLGSIFDPKTQDYKVTSCVNSNDLTDENNNIIDPEISTKEFYSIDNNENFIKYTKVELEIEDEKDSISEVEYYEKLKTPPPQ